MKRIRYVCDICTAEHYVWIERGDEAPQEIDCIHACEGKMKKQFPRPAIHFNLTRGKK